MIRPVSLIGRLMRIQPSPKDHCTGRGEARKCVQETRRFRCARQESEVVPQQQERVEWPTARFGETLDRSNNGSTHTTPLADVHCAR